ncbi:MarR family transcriptional regulator [Erythrobacteraceae bacterium CFH 75059]|uniref:MarR family winged helix-turn-helix transcriptional regulator n=1 Tax=Qipengyuania thermophila TaxID=2509361 RepID=UPI001021C709|nr:MarR family winged helix-turn-helix transcriptional regulator [Qipengyuania thermophila]TCD02287.1 MarR family transcriptional regulator [Erythrobacteraceae bacterium CFH 75059]
MVDFDYGAPGDGPGEARALVSIYADPEPMRLELAEDCIAAGLAVRRHGSLHELVEICHAGAFALLGDVVLVACTEASAAMLASLARLDLTAARTGRSVVVVTALDSLDAVFGCLDQSAAQILVQPARPDRIIALARVRAGRARAVVNEMSAEDRATLLRLTEQIEAISRHLGAGPQAGWDAADGRGVVAIAGASAAPRAGTKADPRGAMPRLRQTRLPLPDPRLVRAVLKHRQQRAALFGADLFADPVWDMLLDLAAARAEHRRVSVTSLCLASGVPPTTALRWLGQMVEAGLVERVRDPDDARRAFVAFTDRTAEAMARYFGQVQQAGILAA